MCYALTALFLPAYASPTHTTVVMIIEVRLFFNIAAPLFIQWRRRANSEHTLVGVEQEPWHRSCFVELIFCPRRALSTIPVFAMKCTLLLVEQFCFPSPLSPRFNVEEEFDAQFWQETYNSSQALALKILHQC